MRPPAPQRPLNRKAMNIDPTKTKYPPANALADLYLGIKTVAKQSRCPLLTDLVDARIYEWGEVDKLNFDHQVEGKTRGVVRIDRTMRDSIVRQIFEGLQGKSVFRLSLQQYDQLFFMVELYMRMLAQQHREHLPPAMWLELRVAMQDVSGSCFYNADPIEL